MTGPPSLVLGGDITTATTGEQKGGAEGEQGRDAGRRAEKPTREGAHRKAGGLAGRRAAGKPAQNQTGLCHNSPGSKMLPEV